MFNGCLGIVCVDEFGGDQEIIRKRGKSGSEAL